MKTEQHAPSMSMNIHATGHDLSVETTLCKNGATWITFRFGNSHVTIFLSPDEIYSLSDKLDSACMDLHQQTICRMADAAKKERGEVNGTLREGQAAEF